MVRAALYYWVDVWMHPIPNQSTVWIEGTRSSALVFRDVVGCSLTLSSTNSLRRESRVLEFPCCWMDCVEVEASCLFTFPSTNPLRYGSRVLRGHQDFTHFYLFWVSSFVSRFLMESSFFHLCDLWVWGYWLLGWVQTLIAIWLRRVGSSLLFCPDRHSLLRRIWRRSVLIRGILGNLLLSPCSWGSSWVPYVLSQLLFLRFRIRLLLLW